jgi:hypothetical protein
MQKNFSIFFQILIFSSLLSLIRRIILLKGSLIFSQLISLLPRYEFNKCVAKYKGNRRVKNFSCWEQFLCMAFAQLTFRSSLRETTTCLNAMRNKLYYMGFRNKNISKSTLSHANENRNWRIYADYAQILINHARKLYRNEDFGVELEETVYALDSTTIDLCLSLFPWAKFRKKKGAIKLHTLLDLHANIPSFIKITDGKVHDIRILDELIPEPGSFYILDRGYLDFARLYLFNLFSAFFIIRSKSNLQFRRIYSHAVDKSTGLRCDQIIKLTGFYPAKDYPDKIRRIQYFDEESKRYFYFLTNNFIQPAFLITKLYKCRWQIELFFKWIKQHLRIKSFYGTSENAVKTQIWIAVSIYVLVAIVKKQLKINISLYTFLQILSLSMFEKIHILQLLRENDFKEQYQCNYKQLSLFDL